MKYIIVSSSNREGITFARGPHGGNRVFVAGPSSWESMNSIQRTAICQLVWATKEGSFEIKDAVSDTLVGKHLIGE